MSNQFPPLCIDCKHYTPPVLPGWFRSGKLSECNNPSTVDIVDGSPGSPHLLRVPYAECGPNGALFESKQS